MTTKKKERFINLRDDEVRAVLEGGPVQIRRPLKTQPVLDRRLWKMPAPFGAGWSDGITTVPCLSGHTLATRGPYGGPGDRLYVREAWTADCDITGSAFGEPKWWHEVPRTFRGLKAVDYLLYRADGAVLHAPRPDPEIGYIGTPAQRASDWRPQDEDRTDLRWQPSTRMPRWASRLTVENVKTQLEQAGKDDPWEWVITIQCVHDQ
jgi:hypothetical protein